ncbi:MAG TPA: GAF domain-containing protein [Acidimicrobiales bacterium]|nr:GAF domain-containing protein [Acidimicrobiales bacterium]
MPQREGSSEARLARLMDLHALLAGVARDIGPATDLGAVLTVVLRAMRSLVAFRGGTICLVDGENQVYVAASDPPVSPEVMAARLPVGSGLAGRVIATGQTVYSPDLDSDRRVDPDLRRLGSNAGMTTFLAVPLVCLGRVIGVLQVDSAEHDAFDDEDVQVLEGLAVQVAGAIESAQRHEEAMRLEQLKSDFIARVSHELRTPLTIVSGFTETLLAHGDGFDESQRAVMLERMQAGMQRLETLVEELLTVSGYEAGVISPRPSRLSVIEVLESVRAAAGDNAERITTSCDPDLSVTADRRLLSHAVTLLVDNALKYAGEAELTAGRDPSTSELIVDVRDHGPGVPGFLGDRVFERFTRGDTNKPGMGLGLPLAKMLAGGCGGRLDLLVPPDGGALFRIRFVAAPVSMAAPPAARSR